MTELHTVPLFIYNQLDKDGMYQEEPIKVLYYNGTISLEHIEEDRVGVNIHPDHLDKLFKEIKRHLPEAKRRLEK